MSREMVLPLFFGLVHVMRPICAIVLIYEMCIVCPFFVSFFVLSEFFCMCLNVACVDMGKCVGGWVASIAKFSWRIIFVFICQNLIVILIKCFLVLVSFVVHLYPWNASDSICLSKQIVIFQVRTTADQLYLLQFQV